MHGALATYKGTFAVKQISLLKLQTCISMILDPRQCLAMPASSRLIVPTTTSNYSKAKLTRSPIIA